MIAVVEAAISPEELCARYAATVSRFAAILSRDPHQAEDLAQEILFRAIRALTRFDSRRGDMEGWLWRIAANVANDVHRASWRRLRLWERLRDSPIRRGDSPEDAALAEIEIVNLRRAIASLAPRERILLGLRFGADLDYRSAAKAVGVSDDAARKTVDRAVLKLRKMMTAKEA